MAAYKVKLTTRAKPVKVKGRTILAIEPEDYTKEQVKALRAAGYTVLGYLSIGSVSNERPYYKRLEPYRLSRLPDSKKKPASGASSARKRSRTWDTSDGGSITPTCWNIMTAGKCMRRSRPSCRISRQHAAGDTS